MDVFRKRSGTESVKNSFALPVQFSETHSRKRQLTPAVVPACMKITQRDSKSLLTGKIWALKKKRKCNSEQRNSTKRRYIVVAVPSGPSGFFSTPLGSERKVPRMKEKQVHGKSVSKERSSKKSKRNLRKRNPEQRDSAKRRCTVGASLPKEHQGHVSWFPERSSKKSKRNSRTSKRNPEQRDSAKRPLGIGRLENVSEALGLRRNFLNGVTSLPEEILLHRGLKGIVLKFIESAYFEIEEQPLKEKLSEELLKQVGFTDSEVINTIITRSEKMRYHLDAIDFMKRFVNDEFKYNPNLIEYATEDETIPDDTEVLPFSDYRNDEQNEHCEFVRLFHGTDLCSAIDIRKNGIELDFGRHKHDFSDGGGFYLTTFEHAENWARSQTRKPVVLEFLKIPKTCFDKARILNLDVSKKEGRLEWYRVVRENRSGRPCKKLRKKMKEFDCIEAPISVPCQDADVSIDQARFKPEPGSYQLCIVKRSFAEEIEKNAKYTLYFDQ